MQLEMDFTQPLESVIAAERNCIYPPKGEDRRYLFERWCELNPEVLEMMDETALRMQERCGRASSKYIAEKLRWEWEGEIEGVPFHDRQGIQHCYKVNNSDTPLIADWLLEHHPDMHIERRERHA